MLKVIAYVFGLGLPFAFFFGYFVGHNSGFDKGQRVGANRVRKEAVARGFANYKAYQDDQDEYGIPSIDFRWNEPPLKKN